MRYFRSIRIDGNPMIMLAIDALGWAEEARAMQQAEKYELRVLEILYKIAQTKTGSAVLRAIEHVSSVGDVFTQKTMTIRPRIDHPTRDRHRGDPGYTGTGEDRAVNAFAEFSELAGAIPKGRIARGPNYVSDKGVIRSDLLRGTGEGSSTTIKFTPEHFKFRTLDLRLHLTTAKWNFEPDEFLLHEMVHGLREMKGLMWQRRVPFQKGYDNIEEFFAVLIANIYRSECGRNKVRKDHGTDFIHMNEEQFIKKGLNRSHLRQLRRQHDLLFSELRQIDVPFNPTRLIKDQ